MIGSRCISALTWTALAIASCSGCVVHRSARGTLQVDWSVNGRQEFCPNRRADTIEISVRGNEKELIARDCTAFVTNIDLLEGNYLGSARLIDINGYPLTPSIDLDEVHVSASETVIVSIKFPANSFYD
jgi:hypothetical protein